MKIKIIVLFLLASVSAFAGLKVKEYSGAVVGPVNGVDYLAGEYVSATHDRIKVGPQDNQAPVQLASGSTLNNTECGQTFINPAFSGGGYILPPASSVLGCRYTFVNSATSNFFVYPALNQDEEIYGPVGQCPNCSIEATAKGAATTIQAVAALTWVQLPGSASFPANASY